MAVVTRVEDFSNIYRRYLTSYELKYENLDGLIQNATKELGFKINANTYNRHIVREIAERYNRDILRLMLGSLQNGPDIYKQAGHITFWIRKLKPLEPLPAQRKKYQHINEFAAMTAGKSLIEGETGLEWDGRGETDEECKEHRIEFLRQFIYNLRYGAFSPSVISQLYYCIFEVVPV